MFSSKKPVYVKQPQKVKALMESLKNGEMLYWQEVQRRDGAWNGSAKTSYIINKINGLSPTSSIVICDLASLIKWNIRQKNHTDVEKFKQCRKDLMEYRREKRMFQHLDEKALRSEDYINGLIDGMHRLTTLHQFCNNLFCLPAGTTLVQEYGGDLTLEEDSFFEDLPKDYQKELLDAECDVIQFTGAKYEQIQKMIIGINSAEPWDEAERRKLIPGSVPSEFVYGAEKKYWEQIQHQCKLTCYRKGKFMTAVSRALSWCVHGVHMKTTDADLNKLHENNLKAKAKSNDIKDQHYKEVATILEDLFKVLDYKEGESYRKGKLCSTYAFYTLILALKALKDPSEINPKSGYKLTVSDYFKWGKWVRECNEHLERTITPRKEDHEDLDAYEFKQLVKKESYENWNVWADPVHVSKRYEEICKYIKKNLGNLLEQGVIKVVRGKGACFSSKQKAEMKKRQGNFDPITNENLRNNAEAHHKVPVAKNGATEINNGVLLNQDTHWQITNNPDLKDLSWGRIIEGATKKTICDAITNKEATLEAAA
tara:strand:+ start:52 stop:1671 length:1620 start_codon:yes stop_codon:yes gene_type:complete